MNIIASIFAAIVGGLLTLSGVIMTINHNNKLKLENDCNQAKPLFSFSQPDYSFKTSARKCFCRENLYSNYPYEVSFVLENSNQSVIYITKIILIMKKSCIDSTDNLLIISIMIVKVAQRFYQQAQYRLKLNSIKMPSFYCNCVTFVETHGIIILIMQRILNQRTMKY